MDWIDLLFLHLDLTANEIKPVVKEGVPSTGPVAPAVAATYELPLAPGWIRASQSAPQATALFEGPVFIGRRFLIVATIAGAQGDLTYRPTR